MKKEKKGTEWSGIMMLAVLCILCAGCAGPSTRVLPGDQAHQVQQNAAEGIPALEEANPFYLQETLDILSATPRVTGSDEEKEAVRYLSQMFADYGYLVNQQEFPLDEDETGQEGINVCAVRYADAPDADIVLVIGSHDTASDSPGAHKGASGVAVMLETARLVAALPTDTELRFVSVSASNEEDRGIRHYLSALSQEEIRRMIGAIRLDGLGYRNSGEMVMRTMDGEPVLLGELYNAVSSELYRENVQYLMDPEGGEAALVRNLIPALQLGERWSAYEDGSAFDEAGIVDIDRLAQIAQALSGTLSDIMSENSPSLVAKSRFYNDLRDGTYVQEQDVEFPFGETYAQTRERMREEGYLSAEHEDDGKHVTVYQFPVKWFGVDQILLTGFYYRDGYLEEIMPDADGAGVELEEMKERISSFYGEPLEEDAGPNGVEYHWQSPEYRLQVTLSPSSRSYDVTIQEYIPVSEELYVGSLREEMLPEDPRMRQVLELVRGLFSGGEFSYETEICLFTDGLGGEKYELTVSEDGRNPAGKKTRLRIDLQDVMTPDGIWRNRTEFVKQMLLWQGEMLAWQNPVYREMFSERFDQLPEGPDVQSEHAEALEGVSGETQADSQTAQIGLRPGKTEVVLPGFVESYRWFVLTDLKEEQENLYEERIRFFYEYEELVKSRERIRNQLHLK